MDEKANMEDVIETTDEHVQKPCHCDVTYCVKQENKSRGNWLLGTHGTIALLSIASSFSSVRTSSENLVEYGPAYFVIYVVMLLFLGLPLVYIGLSMGQFTSNGVLTCWPLPIFKGLGAAMVAYGIPKAVCLNIYSGWAIYYLYHIMNSAVRGTDMPWTSHETVLATFPECNQTNTLKRTFFDTVSSCHDNYTAENGVCWSIDSPHPGINDSDVKRIPINIYNMKEALENYADWIYVGENYVSRVFEEDLESPGTIMYNCKVISRTLLGGMEFNGDMSVCLLVAWLLVMVIMVMGIKGIGVVKMITVPTMLGFLIVLTVRAAALPGTYDALMEVLQKFDVSHLTQYHLWYTAGFSILDVCIAFEWFITYGSYNRFHNNFVRDALMFCVMNIAVLVLWSGLVMGFNGSSNQETPEGVSQEFEILPVLFNGLPLSMLWCCLLFVVVLLIPLHNTIAQTETIVTAVLDQCSQKVRRFRPLFVVILCILLYLLSLTICVGNSNNSIVIMGHAQFFTPQFVIMLTIGVYAIYAVKTYFGHRHDIAAMARFDVCCFPSLCCWGAVTVLLFTLSVLIIMGIVGLHIFDVLMMTPNLDEPLQMSFSSLYHQLLAAYPFIIMLIIPIIQIIWACTGKKPSMHDLFHKIWSPALLKHQNLVYNYRTCNKFSTHQYDQQLPCSLEDQSLKAPLCEAESVNTCDFKTPCSSEDNLA